MTASGRAGKGETTRRTAELLAKLPSSFDAPDWAAAFVALATEKPEVATDEGTMIGWFANALMRGFDEANRRNRTKLNAFEPGGAVEIARNALEGAQTALDIHHREKDCKATICVLIRHALAALDAAREGK